MKRFVEGDDRKQIALLPECVDDYIGQDNPVRVIDAFADELNLAELGARRPVSRINSAGWLCRRRVRWAS